MNDFISKVKFDDKGLVTVILQDHQTLEVLMCAYMNRESLEITLRENKCCYFSRSRQKLWLKGETSGHFQHVKDIRIDCDGDALLILIEQEGGACHKGFESCFYRGFKPGENELSTVSHQCFDPDEKYHKPK